MAVFDDRSRAEKIAARQSATASSSNVIAFEPSSSGVNPLLDFALQYAGRGWPVFPAPIDDKKSHKAARFSNGAKWGQTKDPDEIRLDARRFPDANIGIVCGEVSGIFVLDVDTPEGHGIDGFASLAALEAEHGDLPPTPQAISPSGSRHYVFKHPGHKIKNSTSAIGPGLDVRGDGGMFIGAPSVVPPKAATEDKPAKPGGTYRWADGLSPDDLAPADCPQWLLDRIAAGKEVPEAELGFEEAEAPPAPTPVSEWWPYDEELLTGTARQRREYAEAAMRNECTALARCRAGTRNEALNNAALKLGQLVASGDLSESEVHTALYSASVHNGLVKDDGRASVLATIRSGLTKGFTEPRIIPERAEEDSLEDEETILTPLGEWDAGLDNAAIPPRGWLLGNSFCRQNVSSLLGDGAIGKSTLRYTQMISLAANRSLTGEYVFQRCRVLIVSMEDGTDELRRRIKASLLHHGVKLSEVLGWLLLSAPGIKAGKLIGIDGRGRIAHGTLAEKLSEVIVRRKIDIISLDPFIKTHGVGENDNTAIDKVVQVLTDLAIKHDIAVDVPHHMSKGTSDPGNAKRGRGASAAKDAFRLVYTLTAMELEEAKGYGVSESERRRLVRMDSGKVNIAPPAEDASWFKLVGVRIGNPTDRYPNGDEVQAIEPWLPPEAFADISVLQVNQILSDIDAGLPDGNRYTDAPNATERAAWRVIVNNIPKKPEGVARKIIRMWRASGLLVLRDYHNDAARKDIKGLWVDNEKRPT